MNIKILVLVLSALLISGCANRLSYTTPAAGVSLAEIDDTDIRGLFSTVPAASFPANIAIVRVQDSGYATRTNRGYGHGRYSIVTTRDIETDESFDKVSKLPLVHGIAPIGRLLLPPNPNTIKDLRAPAASLHADLLLIYSVDSSFAVDGKSLGPLSLVSLGFIKNKTAHVTATVAGVLVDVRTGFIYGTTEATATEEQRASIWSTELAIDTSRMKAEQEAFDSFVDEFQDLWTGVLNAHVATGPSVETPVAKTPMAEILHTPADANSYYRVRFDSQP